jgi:hypothetical protein
MGVELETYRFADIIDVANTYVKVRDIQTNKFMCPMEDKIKCSLSYNAVYEKDGKVMVSKRFHINSDEVFISVWEECYSHLKGELTKEGIQHTDRI